MSELYSELIELETMESEELISVIGGKNGADDPAGHVRGGGKGKGKGKGKNKNNPDGPGHT